ncbi:MAG: bifunctional metallophosphatase/5'-nucleotidase [Bacteroidales bacterium]|nr:bifunctional metallophosphatase/5'-nucleotidase [Bacteroidales bacterium]
MKRHFLFFLCLALLCSCQGNHNDGNAKSDFKSDSNLEKEIVILSVNDMHSSIDMFPKFAALVDSLRNVYPDMLVFSAGDNRTGNPVNDQYNPVNFPMISLMNKVGFDLSAVGNHEWDAGTDNLQQNIKQADFPFVCANVTQKDGLNLDIKPYVMLENQGVKIAVVGMIEVRHDGIPGAHPSNLTQVSFKKAIDAMPEYQYLREQCDVMIVLSHLGFEDDVEVAQATPYLDVILGGHTHTLVEFPTEHNGVLVTQAGSHLKYATLTKIKVKDGKVTGKEAITLDVKAFRKSDKEVKAMVDGFNDSPTLNESIGKALTKFDNPEELGCFMTDAIREVSGADFAFQNTGGVRVNYLKAGPITVKDIYTIDPFGNEIVVFEMTGQQVKNFIVDTYRKNGGYPSYVSGMTYEMQTNGKLSAYVTTNSGRFSTKETYKVAMNSYMASTVRFESLDDGQSQYMTSEEMMIEFLRRHKTVDYQGIRRTK